MYYTPHFRDEEPVAIQLLWTTTPKISHQTRPAGSCSLVTPEGPKLFIPDAVWKLSFRGASLRLPATESGAPNFNLQQSSNNSFLCWGSYCSWLFVTMVDYEQDIFSKGEILPVVIHPCFNRSQEFAFYTLCKRKGIGTSYIEFLWVILFGVTLVYVLILAKVVRL